MLFPLFIALAVASSELWGRRIGYLIQKADDILFSKKQDCISGLPDDILFSILSRLSFKEVVKTSILSRRWRYLYASMPNLDFSSLTMFSVPERDHVCNRYLHRFVNGVNQFVQLYSGPKIFSFRFAFCLGREFAADTERWIWFAIRMGVEELDINFTCEFKWDFKYNIRIQRHIFSNLCAFSYQLLSEASKLKRLHLTGCIVMPNFNVKLNSLKNLHLDYVPLAGREVEDILSCCSNLEQLVLRACLLPAKLCIHGPSSLHLKSLSLLYCLGPETVDLCAINLTVFECFDFGSIEFSFSSVPKLESVFLHIAHTAGMSYIFSELPKDLPQLKTLLVRTGAVKLCFIPARITMFSSLRQLELILTNCSRVYHQKIPPILGACPLLQKFCLVIAGGPRYGNGIGTEETPLCRHTQLQEVEFTGFDGTENELNLALYFLRSAVALKRMFIGRNFRFYRGLGNWEDDSFEESSLRSFFCTRLQGKALSRSAEVIVI